MIDQQIEDFVQSAGVTNRAGGTLRNTFVNELSVMKHACSLRNDEHGSKFPSGVFHRICPKCIWNYTLRAFGGSLIPLTLSLEVRFGVVEDHKKFER